MPVDPMIARGINPLGAGYANTMLDIESLKMERQRADMFDQRNALLEQRQRRQWSQEDAQAAAEEQEDAAFEAARAAGDWDAMASIDPEKTQMLWDFERSRKGPAPLEVQQLPGYGSVVTQGGQFKASRPEPAPQRPPQYGPATYSNATVMENGKPVIYAVNTRDPSQRVRVGDGVAPASNPQTSKPPGPQTESDRKATLLFGSIYGAERDISKLEGGTDTSSRGNAVLGAIPLDADLAKGYQSQDYKKYESAAKRWSANLLYMKSGATATPEEVHSTYMQFFPQPGDGQEVKEQKKAARLDEMQSIASTFPWLVEKYDLSALYPAEKPAGKNPQVDALLNPKDGQRGKSKSGKPMIFRNGRWEYE